ncbi:anti-sigma factor [Thalassomonas haliotis]|uniref:Anti-sigma factor n=1 Tax=Thalassomonas haliotis TaxID=485448 RepID=A0ABY7VGR3_9GAMM|nr:anti-sigma factor [Thalassomonas haliotis]WDE12607.1 anti-sigma factor [Thalassomonas haliotis]
MSESINNAPNQRYYHPEVIEHLASQYVLGTLTPLVRQRVDTLVQTNEALEQAILYWQEHLGALDRQTAELPPSDTSWQVIAGQLDMPTSNNTAVNQETSKDTTEINKPLNSWPNRFADKLNNWLARPGYRYAGAFSVLLLAVVISFFNPLTKKQDPLSYVAVLTQQSGQAHLVASTYGESQKLVVNIINAPEISTEESLELWVVSKTDQQARSLGVLPGNQALLEQQLTRAQWRLIKDSESLIVTLEEAGGSAIGEPSEMIVSRGLCIRLQEWNKNA